MADEPNSGSAPSVQDIGGGTLRASPTPAGETNPTLEEQARQQAEAAGGAGKADDGAGGAAGASGGTSEAGDGTGKEAPGAGGPDEGSEKGSGEDFSLEGTVFDGLSPEMQTKIKPFAAAYATNGTLTDAEVTEAAKSTGFSEAAVRQFMAGAGATAGADLAPIFTATGGADNYKQFQDWTAEEGSLTPAEVRNINKALGIGADGKPDAKLTADPEMAAQLMAPAIERWKAAGGGAPARDVTRAAGGEGGQGSTGEVYASWEQLTADQSNPLYRKDPAFRAKVEQKLARSNL